MIIFRVDRYGVVQEVVYDQSTSGVTVEWLGDRGVRIEGIDKLSQNLIAFFKNSGTTFNYGIGMLLYDSIPQYFAAPLTSRVIEVDHWSTVVAATLGAQWLNDSPNLSASEFDYDFKRYIEAFALSNRRYYRNAVWDDARLTEGLREMVAREIQKTASAITPASIADIAGQTLTYLNLTTAGPYHTSLTVMPATVDQERRRYDYDSLLGERLDNLSETLRYWQNGKWITASSEITQARVDGDDIILSTAVDDTYAISFTSSEMLSGRYIYSYLHSHPETAHKAQHLISPTATFPSGATSYFANVEMAEDEFALKYRAPDSYACTIVALQESNADNCVVAASMHRPRVDSQADPSLAIPFTDIDQMFSPDVDVYDPSAVVILLDEITYESIAVQLLDDENHTANIYQWEGNPGSLPDKFTLIATSSWRYSTLPGAATSKTIEIPLLVEGYLTPRSNVMSQQHFAETVLFAVDDGYVRVGMKRAKGARLAKDRVYFNVVAKNAILSAHQEDSLYSGYWQRANFNFHFVPTPMGDMLFAHDSTGNELCESYAARSHVQQTVYWDKNNILNFDFHLPDTETYVCDFAGPLLFADTRFFKMKYAPTNDEWSFVTSGVTNEVINQIPEQQNSPIPAGFYSFGNDWLNAQHYLYLLPNGDYTFINKSGYAPDVCGYSSPTTATLGVMKGIATGSLTQSGSANVKTIYIDDLMDGAGSPYSPFGCATDMGLTVNSEWNGITLSNGSASDALYRHYD